MTSGNMTIRLIIGGFAIITFLLVVLGGVAVRQNMLLARQIEYLYAHPLTVSNAVLEANVGILAIQSRMHDVVWSQNDAVVEDAIADIDIIEQGVHQNIAIVNDRFLGDALQVAVARDAFADWKGIRAEIIAQVRLNNHDAATVLYETKSAQQVALLSERMEVLIGFARNKAEELHSESQAARKQSLYQLYWIVSGLFVVAAFTAFVVIRGVAQTDRELAQSVAESDFFRRRFQSIFNAISDGIVLADTDRTIVAANAGMKTTFGYEPHELIGNKTSMLYESVEEYERQGQLRFNLSPQKKSAPYVVNYKHKDGHIFAAETLGATVTDEGGAVIAFLGVMRDISDRIETENVMRQSHKMESLGYLAGGVAHDVNNMLLPIISLAQMSLKDVPPESRIHTRLEKIAEAGVRAGELIANILAFSHRDDAGLHLQTVHLLELVQKTLGILRATVPSTVNITVDFPPDLVRVDCDASQISSVIMNLASNAVYAMAGQVGTLSISVERLDVSPAMAENVLNLRPGPYAKLSVTDTGAGMDRKTMEKIFDPFFTTKEVGQGTGMGLSMAYGIVKKHDGAIRVSSKVGQGSTFDVYLPISEHEDDLNVHLPAPPPAEE